MRTRHYGIVIIIVLVASAASYRFGIKVMKDASVEVLASTQAMHSFNHLRRYEELSDCLSKGMDKEAAEKLRMSVINEKEYISEFLNAHDDAWLNKYITIRYPRGIDSLKTFKSGRGASWSEPAC
jgi:hypothetical protein